MSSHLLRKATFLSSGSYTVAIIGYYNPVSIRFFLSCFSRSWLSSSVCFPSSQGWDANLRLDASKGWNSVVLWTAQMSLWRKIRRREGILKMSPSAIMDVIPSSSIPPMRMASAPRRNETCRLPEQDITW